MSILVLVVWVLVFGAICLLIQRIPETAVPQTYKTIAIILLTLFAIIWVAQAITGVFPGLYIHT